MKKFLAVLTVTVMLLALFAEPVFGFAYNAPKFYLTGPEAAKVGDTVKVSLCIEGEYEAHIINVTVYFDKTSFKYKGRSFGEAYTESVMTGGMGVCDIREDGEGVALGLMMYVDPATAQGVLVEISFEVLPTASSQGNFTISVGSFAYMPIGESNADEIVCATEGLTMKLTGGTGPEATPVPGPGEHSTPAPTAAPTGDPKYTGDPKNTSGPSGTESAATGTPQASEGNAVKVTPEPGATSVTGPTPTPNPAATDEAGNPITTNEAGEPVTTDEAGNPVTTDEAGNPVATDEAGNPIATDEAGNPIATDEAGNPIPTENDKPGEGGNKALKTGLIIGGSVLGAGVITLLAFILAGKKRRKK